MMTDPWKDAWQTQPQGTTEPPPLGGSAPSPRPFAPSPPPAVHSLGYVGYGPTNPPPRVNERVGLIIAIAVTSILIALIGLLLNIRSSLYWARMYRGSIPPAPAKIAPPPPVTLAPYDGDFIGAHGMHADLREAVIAAWEKSDGHALSHDRRAMLSELLTDCGTDLFPAHDAAGIAQSITRVGSVSPGRFGSGRFGQQYMLTTGGRIDLDSDMATFTPGATEPPEPVPPSPLTDLSRIPSNLPPRVRQDMIQMRNAIVPSPTAVPLPAGAMRVQGNIFVDSAGKAHWSAGAISQRIEDLRQDMKGNLNAIQAAAIIAEVQKLSSPSATRGRPAFSWRGGHIPPDPQELPVSYEAGAPTTPIFNIGYKRVYVLQKGWVLPLNPGSGRVIDPETGTDYPAALRFVPRLAGSTSAMFALEVETGLGAFLAGFLLICGIVVLISRPIGLRLHLIWVPLKFGLLALCIIATTVYFTSVGHLNFANTRAGSAASARWYGMIGGLVVHMLLQAVYPTVLLIVLFGPLRRFVKRLPDRSGTNAPPPIPPYAGARGWAPPPPPLRIIILVFSIIAIFSASTVHAQRAPRTRPAPRSLQVTPAMPDPFGESLRDTPLRVEELAYVNDHQRTVDMGQYKVEQLVKYRPGGVPALIGLMADKSYYHTKSAINALSRIPISDADRPLVLAHLNDLDAVLRTTSNSPERSAAATILLVLKSDPQTAPYLADLFYAALPRPLYEQAIAALPTDDAGRQAVATRMLENSKTDPKVLSQFNSDSFIFALEQLGEPGRNAILEIVRDPHPAVSAVALKAFVRPSQHDARLNRIDRRLELSNYPEDQPVPAEVKQVATAMLKASDPEAAQTAVEILAGADSKGREQVIEYMLHPIPRSRRNQQPRPAAMEPMLALQAALPYTRDVAKGVALCDAANPQQVAATAQIFQLLNQQPPEDAAVAILDLVDSPDADLHDAACRIVSRTSLARLAGAHTLHELADWQPIFNYDFRRRVTPPPPPAGGPVVRGSAWAPAPLHLPAVSRPTQPAASSPWPSVSLYLLAAFVIAGLSLLLIRLAMR